MFSFFSLSNKRWLIKRPRWNRAFLPQPRSDQRSQTALTKGVCNDKANQPGQERPIQIKIPTGHDVVKSCTWSHHLILTTNSKSGPHPVIVLTPISPLQLWTSTWECAVTCTDLPYTSAFCIMVISMQSEGHISVGKLHFLSTHSIQVEAFYSCQLTKNLFLLHFSIIFKELNVPTKRKYLL